MRILPLRSWTAVLRSWKPDGISTLCCMIPWHPERNHQTMANSPTVHWVSGFLTSPVSTRLESICAGRLQRMRKLDSNFKSHLHQDTTHSITGVIWQCGCFHVPLTIQRMIQGWKSIMQSIRFDSEEFDGSYPDRWQRRSTGCCVPDDKECEDLDDMQVVGIENCPWIITSEDAAGECTSQWSCIAWEWVTKTDGPGEEKHFTGSFESMQGASMVACMLFVSVGRHIGSQQHISTMVHRMAPWKFGGFADFPMGARDISANVHRQTCRGSRIWQRWQISKGDSSETSDTW